MAIVKPPSKTGNGLRFPYAFEKNGRTGKIKKWGDGKFGTYFLFGTTKVRNSFRSFEAAWDYLDREFSKLDTDRANSIALHPINHDIKAHSELEQIPRERGGGATLREAVQFYLNHYEHETFTPATVGACVEALLADEKSRNHSALHERTLTRHLGHFVEDFGHRQIHEVTARKMSDWLKDFRQEEGDPWAVKTRISVRGTLVSLFIYARDMLKAIRNKERTEAQLVKNPQRGAKEEVGIDTPDQMRMLLPTALDTDKWESVHWADRRLDVLGKVRSKARWHLPLHPVTEAWLQPLREVSGPIWKLEKSYTYKMRNLPGSQR